MSGGQSDTFKKLPVDIKELVSDFIITKEDVKDNYKHVLDEMVETHDCWEEDRILMEPRDGRNSFYLYLCRSVIDEYALKYQPLYHLKHNRCYVEEYYSSDEED